MEIGKRLEISHQVTSVDLAKALSNDPKDDFPEVFATSKMIALMELAAARLMQPLLQEGELSVGVNVDIAHLAATPNNVKVSAIAIYRGVEAKLHKFDVIVCDPAGEVGKGTHTRAIIKTERLLQGAVNRLRDEI